MNKGIVFGLTIAGMGLAILLELTIQYLWHNPPSLAATGTVLTIAGIVIAGIAADLES